MPEILYICDHRACERCNGIEGCYTTDISHAVNFAKLNDFYYEKEPTMTTTSTNTVETEEIKMSPEEQQEAWSEKMEKCYKEKSFKKKPLTEEQKADRRFWNFLDMVYKLAQMSGLYIEGHIKVRDTKTGKVWE